MERLRMKNLLLACAIMLGIQFCCPLVLGAGEHAPVAELISLGVKDAEGEVEVSTDVLFVHLHQVAFCTRGPVAATPFQGGVEPVGHHAVPLPTTGRFPSAP
ncbi:MAG: hypothetical protein ACO1NQ_12855 [Flavobacteriales bacterium]